MAKERASGFTMTEKRVVTTSIVMMLLFGALFVDERLASWIFGSDAGLGDRPFIGRLAERNNDVRQKDARRYAWKSASKAARLTLGDSLFTGEGSRANVELDGGVHVDLGPNSLIRFKGAGKDAIPDLKFGALRFEGRGEAKFMVNGEVVKVPLTDGAVDITLTKDRGLEVRGKRGLIKKVLAASKTKTLEYPPVGWPDEPTSIVWTFDDLYDRSATPVARRAHLPTSLVLARTLRWRDLEEGPYRVQVASNPSFKGTLFEGTAEGKEFTTTNVFVEHSFWRVARSRGPWSDPQRLDVGVSFLRTAPILAPTVVNLPFLGDPVSTSWRWTLPAGLSSTLVEISEKPDFPAAETSVEWTPAQEFTATFATAGRRYVRLIGLNERQELSVPSGSMAIDVETPPLLGQVKLPRGSLKFELEPKAVPKISWRPPEGWERASVRVLDAKGEVVLEKELRAQSVKLEALAEGDYRYEVIAIDRWGRKGEPGPPKKFSVHFLPPPEPARAPAQEAASVIAAEIATPSPVPPKLHFNDAYANSSFRLDGGTFGMFSSEQVAAKESLPVATAISMRWTHWWKNLGVDWSYQTKLFNANAAASDVAPSMVEARVWTRTSFGWNWLTSLRELQTSAFLGYELYRNPQGGSLYASKYDLVKAGVGLEFPIGEKLMSGGEVAYGTSADQSTKFELSGHVDYFLRKNWTLGIGYRASAFQAGTAAASPLGVLPYREAYGEGFSSLRYFY